MFLVLLDLSAAFDTLEHDIILIRMEESIGLSGTALEWMRSYLCGRSQSVVINDVTSEAQELKYGVPQGSVLGPIIFTIYTSPIGRIARRYNLEIHLYADDTQLYIYFKMKTPASQWEALRVLHSCVGEMRVWMTENKLLLNDTKTEFLAICAPWYRDRVEVKNLSVGESQVASVPGARNLGVFMDQSLNMDTHIQRLCGVSVAQLRHIADVRHCLTQDAAEKLVHAFITSRLDYCNALFLGVSAGSLQKLQRLQNMAARVLTRTRRCQHITPVLHQLHWLPVQYRVQYKTMLLTYRALHGLAPQYLTDLLPAATAGRTLRSSSQNNLLVPRTKLKTYGDRAFSVAAPRLWNALPPKLKESETVAAFKRALKTYYFSLAYT